MSSSFQQNWFHVFWTSFAKDILFPICEIEVDPFPFGVYNILLDYDFSLNILVVLVVTIPTSPRLSKTEFVGESIAVLFSVFFSKQKFKKKKKKKLLGRPGRLQAGTRPELSGCLPAHRIAA